jgi:hypothetical protein
VSAPQFDDPVTNRIAVFLDSIGMGVHLAYIAEPTLLPGIKIEAGELLVDAARLNNPGDLLHEAGHIAVVPDLDRPHLYGDAGADGSAEMAALAWSYAACVHLGLDPSVVNYPDGLIGVSLLQVWGLTGGVAPYPRMLRWMR